MEIVEVVRQWQAGVSQRGIARATGLARETVKKYLAAASRLGLSAHGPPPSAEQLAALVRRRWRRTPSGYASGSRTSGCN